MASVTVERLTRAGQAAERAARAVGIVVRAIETNDEVSAAADLLAEVWGTPRTETPVPANLLRAFVHAENYVAGGFTDETLIGVSVGFLAHSNGAGCLHSHITGVRSDMQSRKIGFALKQHQRAWAIQRGIQTIVWTFDPLVRRNAYFNLMKLGALITGYHENFYGPMSDSINGQDKDSDRCVVSWPVSAPRAEAAAEGRNEELDEQELVRCGAILVLDIGSDGGPVSSSRVGDVLLARIPENIVDMRRKEPEVGAAWRHAIRRSFAAPLRDGFVVTGMTRSGCYVLTRAA